MKNNNLKFKVGDKCLVVKYINWFSDEEKDRSIGKIIIIRGIRESEKFPYICSDCIVRCDEELELEEELELDKKSEQVEKFKISGKNKKEWTLNNLPKKVKVVKENYKWKVGLIFEDQQNGFYNGKNYGCVKDIIYLGLLAGVLEPVEEEDKVEEFIEMYEKFLVENNFFLWSCGSLRVADKNYLRENLKDELFSEEEKEIIILSLKYCRHRITKHNKSMVNLEKLEKLLDKLK